MKKNLPLIALFLLTITSLQAQEEFPQITFSPVNSLNINPELGETFSDFLIYDFDTEGFFNQTNNQEIKCRINMENGKQFNIQAFPYDMRADDYRLHTIAQNLPFDYPRSTCSFYKGYTSAGGTIMMMVDSSRFVCHIAERNNTWVMESLSLLDEKYKSNQIIFYNGRSVKVKGKLDCAVSRAQERVAQLAKDTTIITPRNVGCNQVAIAIAADSEMFNQFGSVQAVESYTALLMGLTEFYFTSGNYPGIDFPDVQFTISEQFVSTSPSTDPDPSNSSNISTVFNEFRAWAGQNFTSGYDLAQYHVNKNLSSAGLATVGPNCNGTYHHVLEYQSSRPSGTQAAITAHEIGHNFGCTHNYSQSQGSPEYCPTPPGRGALVMDPVISAIPVSWSDGSGPCEFANSEQSLNSFLSPASCYQSCIGTPPVAGFATNNSTPCVGAPVQFTDLSSGTNNSYLWSFPGGSPASSTMANPTVVYSASGNYSVTLTVTNPNGTDTESRSNLIFVQPDNGLYTPGCTPNNSNPGDGGLTLISFGGASFSSGTALEDGEVYVKNCNSPVNIDPGTTYPLTIGIGNCTAGLAQFARVYLDANGDGDFNDAGELVFDPLIGGRYRGWCGTRSSVLGVPLNIIIPSNVVSNTVLALRVVVSNGLPDACANPTEGQVEDFAVINGAIVLPVTLTHFTGHEKDGQSVLNWETASEENNDHFTLERSFDGKQFEELSIISGRGFSSVASAYQFVDEKPRIGTNYYRLSQTDFDGRMEYVGDVIALTFGGKESFTLFPNPVSNDRLNLHYQTEQSTNLELNIFDLNGRQMYTQVNEIDRGNNELQISVSNIPAGIYLLRITNGDQMQYQKFIRQ